MKKKGFTLVELIVVIAIIGVISIIAGSNYLKVIKDNKESRCEQTRILLEKKALDYHNNLKESERKEKYDINTIADYYEISLKDIKNIECNDEDIANGICTSEDRNYYVEISKKGINGLLEASLSKGVCNEK